MLFLKNGENMEKRKKVFKALDVVHCFYWFLFLVIFIPFDLTLIFTPFDLSLLITVLCMNGIPTLIFILVRVFYNVKYIIDERYLVKYKGKKIVFKISIQDVETVFIRKAKWYAFFPFVLALVCGDIPKGKSLTCLSLVYQNCEIVKEEKREIKRPSLKNETYRSFFEHSEFFSLRKCKKICKKMGNDPIFVK